MHISLVNLVLTSWLCKDLHTGNLALAIKDSQVLSETNIMKMLGQPEIGDVTTRDEGILEPGVPRYLVWPVAFPMPRSPDDWSIKVVDYGESFLRDQVPKTLHTPLVVRAPEVIFQDSFDYRVDLWSMGCMVRHQSRTMSVINY